MKILILFGCLLATWLTANPAAAQNLALGKTATASSQVQAAAKAFDGDGNTRWESAASDPQYIVVNLGSVQTIDRIRLTWENAYGKDFTLAVSSDNTTWTTVATTTNNATTGNEYSNLKARGQYVRLNGTARATTYGYSLYEFEVFNYSNDTANNLALGKTGTASSTQGGFPARNAFDNDNATRWGSNYADGEWLYVDLRGTATISRMYLIWETAYGKDFRLEVSNDAATWTAVKMFTGNTLHYNEVSFSPAVTGRYVRMFGVTRGTGYGFSLYEFQVYGTLVPLPLPVTLASFGAVPQTAAVAVRWATATEHNSASFEVQRSADGASFARLAAVPAAGNSQSARAYEYLDAAPLRTTAYYRLKQLDIDGQVAYGPVVAVQAAAPAPATAGVALSFFPNPATDRATLQWSAAAAGAARWSLMTTAGQLVHTETFATQAGPNAQPIDLGPYAAGSYVLTLETAGQVRHTLVQKAN
ncbi:discoidin domain-containing protein [Hymenobacter nivis]|uniref:T9SS C-terminal target domain-containing protein n=1 Tax=Hymenobacter nivis TaxID=1850093 RepID=A0A502G7X7_9BACT|nr:discoidin domain-containing protein [Hymenobacter nivis]TPG58227.1 T9SS C-terminal target domain-containing protein [Hymenobacter nivis]